MDILKISGVKEDATFKDAQAALAALGGKGVIIAVQNDNKDWKAAPDVGNFATHFGTYWEYGNHGDAAPGRLIIHSPNLPGDSKYTVYLVVPLP